MQAQQNEEDVSLKIKSIQKQLTLLKNKLNLSKGKEQQLLQKLEAQDNEINSVAKEVVSVDKQLKIISTEVDKNQQLITDKSRSIEKQKVQVANLLKLQVYLNHDKTIKMLLVNPNNENSIETKHKIKYLQNKLFTLIKSVASEIKQLQKVKQNQEVLLKKENLKQQALLAKQDKLLEKRKVRLNTLKELKKEISKDSKESKRLSNDQKRLQQLFLEIKNLLTDLPDSLGSEIPFRKRKGFLNKPIKGVYTHSFRSRRSANTKWNGVVIQGKLGDSVKAVAYGRIAFADWLRGFGMLVIIDHQNGYMSLYGFNESINVEVGDWVKENQAIATVGSSGTLLTPSLYFEIRKDAKPLNPKKWLK
jgi:septal ring factor EnvC (AmiA/AmiB activator)